MRLSNRVAIVTGAQQGIGRAIALAFAREGARLVVNYLDDQGAAEEVAGSIRAGGGAAEIVQADVAEASDVCRLIAAADTFGGADILVNNAGIFPRVPFLEMTEANWDEVLGVNLKGAFLGTREAAAAMVAAGRTGAIVSIASGAAYSGPPLGVHYAASKAGIIGLTRAAAMALAPHGIRVNAIAPGLTDTAQPRYGMSEEEIAAMAAKLPLGRIVEPGEVADLAVFLVSDEAKQITGQTVHVNAGSYLN
jgi:3-oxoacyl-[acyl-carrier protein] reductase